MTTEQKFHELKYIIEGVGEHAYKYFDSDNTEHENKRDKSVVTKVDKEVESMLRKYIKDNFPDDTIVGEEEEMSTGKSDFVWYIDPIDGTDNFLRKIPFFAISVARLGDDEAESFAIIHNPATGQTFSTFKESVGEVYENERICKLTAEPLGGRYFIAVGTKTKERPEGEKWINPTTTFALKKGLELKYGKCRAYSCCSLELAYLAAGRIDAFITYGLDNFDYAGGLLLTKAAGGAISIFENGKWTRWDKSLKELCSGNTGGKILFISHPDMHADMLSTIGDPRNWAER